MSLPASIRCQTFSTLENKSFASLLKNLIISGVKGAVARCSNLCENSIDARPESTCKVKRSGTVIIESMWVCNKSHGGE